MALKSDAATEASKNQLSRDFWGCSIFDFCNSIGPTPTSGDVCFCAAVGRKADVAIAAVEPMIDLDGRGRIIGIIISADVGLGAGGLLGGGGLLLLLLLGQRCQLLPAR